MLRMAKYDFSLIFVMCLFGFLFLFKTEGFVSIHCWCVKKEKDNHANIVVEVQCVGFNKAIQSLLSSPFFSHRCDVAHTQTKVLLPNVDSHPYAFLE